MLTLTLPQLVAGRGLAAAAVARLGTIVDDVVVVDARALASGTGSFAAQLVQSIAVDAHAAHLTVLGGPDDFVADLRSAAQALQVTDRVTFTSSDAPLNVAS